MQMTGKFLNVDGYFIKRKIIKKARKNVCGWMDIQLTVLSCVGLISALKNRSKIQIQINFLEL